MENNKKQKNTEKSVERIVRKLVHHLNKDKCFANPMRKIGYLYRHFDKYHYDREIRLVDRAENYFPVGPGMGSNKLKLAAAKIFKRVKNKLEDLQTGVKNCLEEMNSEIEAVKVDPKHIAAEIKYLLKLFDDVKYEDGRLSAVTKNEIILSLDDGSYETNFGKFRIVLDFDRSEIEAIAVDPVECPGNSSITHPHVSRDYICLGDGYEAVLLAKEEYRICDVFQIAESVLKTYSYENPHASLEQWHEEYYSCNICGDGDLSEDSIYGCEQCNNSYCENCMGGCDDCGRSLCVDCSIYCDDCCTCSCNKCLEECKNCKNKLCKCQLEECGTCSKSDNCKSCAVDCQICGTHTCNDCLMACEKCKGSEICEQCMDECLVCDKNICSDCTKNCDYCGESVCESCETICCLFKEKENAGTEAKI